MSLPPRTTAVRGTRFEVQHSARGLDPGAFDAQGVGSVPIAKLIRRLGAVDPAMLQRVETTVKDWLGLS